jgi:spore maturation protein CgeB
MTLNIVVFGLSITSSWGNGHAVTYRALIKALAARGHHVTFLERDVSWYRDNRDLPSADYCRIEIYKELRDIPARYGSLVADADLVLLGSYVPDGATIGDWITSKANGVTAFYDIDTPATLSGLESRRIDYLSPNLIPRFDLYLSFTGGPTLDLLQEHYGSPCARPLYCSAEIEPDATSDGEREWTLGYLGTYSKDRQPTLARFLIEPARRLRDACFVVAGSQYPNSLRWPKNVTRMEHLPPRQHPGYYARQRFTLNVTRANMVAAGYSPSVRLFEAAACGVPVISDRWVGIETFFKLGEEILLVDTADDVLALLKDLPENRRRQIAQAARGRYFAAHTPAHRARDLETYYRALVQSKPAAALAEDVA